MEYGHLIIMCEGNASGIICMLHQQVDHDLWSHWKFESSNLEFKLVVYGFYKFTEKEKGKMIYQNGLHLHCSRNNEHLRANFFLIDTNLGRQ